MSTIAGGAIGRDVACVGTGVFIFLSIPTMVAATGYDLLKSLMGNSANPSAFRTLMLTGGLVLAIGFVVSFVVAYGRWHGLWDGKAAGVRHRLRYTHGCGSGSGVLGIADGWMSTSYCGDALLALIPNTQFEFICSGGTSVWYHRSVREFLQAGLRQRQHPPRHSAFPKS